MKQEDLLILTQIYNTLTLVHTNGEDTIIMGDCLKSFYSFLMSHKENQLKEE